MYKVDQKKKKFIKKTILKFDPKNLENESLKL